MTPFTTARLLQKADIVEQMLTGIPSNEKFLPVPELLRDIIRRKLLAIELTDAVVDSITDLVERLRREQDRLHSKNEVIDTYKEMKKDHEEAKHELRRSRDEAVDRLRITGPVPADGHRTAAPIH